MKQYYHNVEMANYTELASVLGISKQSVATMSNKRKRLLLQLGLTYKNKLDEDFGYEFYKLKALKGGVRGKGDKE